MKIFKENIKILRSSQSILSFFFKVSNVIIVVFTFQYCTSKSKRAIVLKENAHNIKKEINSMTKALAFYPTSTTKQIIKHQYYTVSYSKKDRQPEWVAYKVINSNINNINRTNNYREDVFNNTTSASPDDYQNSGYDMGHLAPAKTMSQNEVSMSESFYLSNISPQLPSFNRGIWKRLENKVRYWAEFSDSLYVVSGPILKNPLGKIGSNNITIPNAFYKVVLRFKNNKSVGIAFLIPHKKSDTSIYSYAVSIDSLEILTGIDFNKKLNAQLQNKLESNSNVKRFISTKVLD